MDSPVAVVLSFSSLLCEDAADRWFRIVSGLSQALSSQDANPHGSAQPLCLYALANPSSYKGVELWSFSKGLPVSQVVNTGTTDSEGNGEREEVEWNGLAKVWRAASASPSSACRGLLYLNCNWEWSVDVHEATELLASLVSSSSPVILRGGGGGGSESAAASSSPLLALFLTADRCNGAACFGSEETLRTTADLLVSEALSFLASSGMLVPGAQPPPLQQSQLTWRKAAPILLPPSSPSPSPAPVVPHHRARAFARVGLLGNPSDGYQGATLSLTIGNHWAEALLQPNADEKDSSIRIVPHPFYDRNAFAGGFRNAAELSALSSREGYSGGLRLLQATVYRFSRHLASLPSLLPSSVFEAGGALSGWKPNARGYSLAFDTTVPRQVGLAGSSAIVTAAVRCLMAQHGLADPAKAAAALLDDDRLPSFVLAIEMEELGITAGLQDRVVQAMGGLVYMSFRPGSLHGALLSGPPPPPASGPPFGLYRRLPISSLPPLFLAHAADPSDSGRIHSPVKQRWLAGEEAVVNGMKAIAALADKGKELCETRSYGAAIKAGDLAEAEDIAAEWASLFATNFSHRLSLWGAPALGKDNLRMIAIAGEQGTAAKFPGSGGAVVGVVSCKGILGPLTMDDAEAEATGTGLKESKRVKLALGKLRTAYEREGFVFTPLYPAAAAPPSEE